LLSRSKTLSFRSRAILISGKRVQGRKAHAGRVPFCICPAAIRRGLGDTTLDQASAIPLLSGLPWRRMESWVFVAQRLSTNPTHTVSDNTRRKILSDG
jgi:hypothetical protein